MSACVSNVEESCVSSSTVEQCTVSDWGVVKAGSGSSGGSEECGPPALRRGRSTSFDGNKKMFAASVDEWPATGLHLEV